MRKRGVVLALGLLVAATSAFADMNWDFTSGVEGWETNPDPAWGTHGMAMTWAAEGTADGKLVLTFDGNWPATTTEAEFQPNLFRFWWSDQDNWDSLNGTLEDGGPTGRYCVIRYKINGTSTPPTGAPSWGRFDPNVTVARASGVDVSPWIIPQMGEWITDVWEIPHTADPAGSITVRMGTAGDGSHLFLPDPGDTIEIDFIRFVDDATPYLVNDFSTDNGVWQNIGPMVHGLGGFASTAVNDGVMACTFESAEFAGFYPMLVNEDTAIANVANAAAPGVPVRYLNMRCRVNCDPSLAQLRALLLWDDGSGFGGAFVDGVFADSVDLTFPTNEWTTVSFDLASAAGWTQSDWTARGAHTWTLQLGRTGLDGDADKAIQNALAGGSIEIDYIAFGATPTADLDVDDDGLTDSYEIENDLDPQDATGDNGADGDFDGDGLTNGDEVTEGTSPSNGDSDSDGVTDGEEVTGGLNPLDDDTDSDGLIDGWEVTNGLDATDATGANGADGDPDGDGFSNLDEQTAGTDPQDINSAPAGMPTAAPWALMATALLLLAGMWTAYRRRRA